MAKVANDWDIKLDLSDYSKGLYLYYYPTVPV